MDFLGFQNETNLRYRGEYISLAVLPLLKLLSLAVFGIVLSKTELVPRSTFKLLSKLVFALFLPCTIFVHLGESITLKNFTLWWFMPVNILISTTIGCILGIIVAIITRPPPEFFRFTVIVTAFGNTGNLPLAIIGSVCHSSDNPFGPDCHKSGVAYVSFAQWVSAILVYTLVFHMMETPLEYYEVVEGDIEEEIGGNDISRPLLVEAEWPGMEEKETEHSKTPIIAQIFTNISTTSIPDPEISEDSGRQHQQQQQSVSPKSIRCLAEPRMVRRMRVVAEQTPVRDILRPPVIAILLAFIVGMIPFLKSMVFDDDAALSFITDSLDIMATPLVPSVMLVLGGMLAEGKGGGPNESRLGTRTTVGIIIARLLVLPSIGIGVIYLADKLDFLIHGDQMYRFVLLLQYTTPSAILFGAMASLRGYAVTEASALLFWQHIFAIFSLTLYVIIYFKLLLSYA